MTKVKQVLDESLVACVLQQGYDEDQTLENVKLGLMAVACFLAMTAQFYPMPFPESRPLLGGCCFGYFLLSTVLQFITCVHRARRLPTRCGAGRSIRQPCCCSAIRR